MKDHETNSERVLVWPNFDSRASRRGKNRTVDVMCVQYLSNGNWSGLYFQIQLKGRPQNIVSIGQSTVYGTENADGEDHMYLSNIRILSGENQSFW